MRPRVVQGVNQKEEDPEPARQEKPSLRTSFARIIEDQVEELLEGMLERRKFGPAMYLLEKRSTQSFLEDCAISQTSFPKKEILASLAGRTPKPPHCLERAILFHPKKYNDYKHIK
jgi:hypothetical protein